MPRQIALAFGCIRDTADNRDIPFKPKLAVVKALPPAVDLRSKCPPVYDQGRVGSCVPNAMAGAMEYDRMNNGQTPDFVPSRLYIYYYARVLDSDVPYDKGTSIRSGLKAVRKWGVCPEDKTPGLNPAAIWPYADVPGVSTDPQGLPTSGNGGKFPPKTIPVTEPSAPCIALAKKYKIEDNGYRYIEQDLTQLKATLASGIPIMFGFEVFPSWVKKVPLPKTIPVPNKTEASTSRHAVLCVGYNDKTFIIRNSWGTTRKGEPVGDKGYFYMPYEYILNTKWCTDFWVITGMTN